MTKRYLESLPQAEQNAILGDIDNAYITPDRHDEWTNDAENEPTDDERAYHEAAEQLEAWEWGRALIEEDEPDDDFYRGEGDLECEI
jgi:hypothetical protein